MLLASIMTLILPAAGWAQNKEVKNDAYVDKQGVIRWRNSDEEVKAFGVNYTTMFAHAYRTAKRMNVPLEKAIDDDVYHFARLGFDAFRVHVWDCEISDSVGNLLTNDHLRLFDYALKKMKDRGMKFILTPIAYWPNGYPEAPEKTPGFATKYGKEACLTNEEAIRAQEKYLFQFLNHVNQYTGVAYKDDPAILAFEISNEPHHHEEAKNVTAFINRMVKSMRTTGCKKPIFYNISHSIQLADAYFDADIQGGTFQWYPTGLGARHELGGNLLPNVNQYTIPFAANPKFRSMARIVYEFDAADVGRSYIYPVHYCKRQRSHTHTYPSGAEGDPDDWDFYDDTPYKTRVVKSGSPAYLFEAFANAGQLSRQWLRTTVLRPLPEPGKAELLVNVEKLFTVDPENKNSEPVNDYSLRYYFGEQLKGRKNDLASMKKLIFTGNALNDKPCALQLALIMRDGSTFGGIITLGTERKDYTLSLTDLKPVRLVTLPRPYPTFLPYFFTTGSVCEFDVSAVESLQLSIGPGIPAADLQQQHGIAIESVRLE